MKVGVPKETVAGERRVALIPDVAGRLVKSGLTVVVEAGAGAEAGLPDDAYRSVGAEIGDPWGAEIVVKVQRPSAAETAKLREGAAFVATMQAATSPDTLQALAQRRVTAFSLELLPRITRAQAMDVLSSQATVAGYKATLVAADAANRFFPMLVTAAGTLPPARALVLGAGVAGLQAIATLRRLGAVVSAFDVRPVVKEQVESLGAAFLAMEQPVEGEGTGGYAKELSADQHQRELDLLAHAARDQDIIITTAQIPGKPAPRLLTQAAVAGMKPGSVIVDLAAESGGNCELTRAGERVVYNGVVILGPVNLPAAMPLHASQMYAKNIQNFLQLLIKDGALTVDFQDEIVRDTCVTHDGKVLRA